MEAFIQEKMDFASILQGGTVKSEKPTFPNYFFHGHDICGREKIAFNYMGFCHAPFIKVCNLETRQKMKFSPFFPLQGNKKTLEAGFASISQPFNYWN